MKWNKITTRAQSEKNFHFLALEDMRLLSLYVVANRENIAQKNIEIVTQENVCSAHIYLYIYTHTISWVWGYEKKKEKK